MKHQHLAKRTIQIYPILGAALFIGLLLLVKHYSGLVSIQLVLIAILFYVGLAYVYHHFDKTLTVEVIVEYILLGLLIVIILQSYLL